jgi:hypothetical protein
VTATINYDRHIVNLIDELSRTGHVTHTKYKKKSVTLHHNGGVRFSHQTILNIWKTRPASAHFDIDAVGDPAQYVEAHEYAWAVGNTRGNQETISIEMANISGAPHWGVSEATWQGAARLAGFLFAHVIDGTPRPTRNNFFVHHHWYQTACAGPFVDSVFDQILHAAQQAYDHFRGSAPAPATPSAPTNPVRDIQRALEVDADGHWGSATDHRARLMRAAARAHAGYPSNAPSTFDVATVQRIIDVTVDSRWGPKTQAALVVWINQFQHALGVRADGSWGPATEDRFNAIRNRYLIR